MRTFMRTAALALALVAPGAAAAATFTVPVDFPTIQGAIDAAATGDTILVEPGTYHGQLVINGKALAISSTGGPEVTILDGDAAGTVVFFSNPSSRPANGASLSGFTVTNGNGNWGGGVSAVFSGLTIRNCIITGNAAINGGGVAGYLGYMVVTVQDSVISNNRATTWGGGTFGTFGGLVLYRTLVTGNTAGISGGGMAGRGQCGLAIAYESTITGNDAAQAGGGVWVGEGDSCNHTTLVNTVVAHNSAARGGGVAAEGPAYIDLVHATVADNAAPEGGGIWAAPTTGLGLQNSIVWGNGALPVLPPPVIGPTMVPNIVTGSVVEGGVSSAYEPDPAVTTNSAADPAFLVSDYRLSLGSPAIELGVAVIPRGAAAQTIDHDGVARPQGARPDAGAFEWVDTLPPVTTLTLQGTSGAAGWYTSAVTAALRSADVGLGVRELHFALDGGADTTVPGAAADLLVDGEGAHALAYGAVDLGGNAEPLRTAAIRIDRAAPSVTASVAGTPGSAGWLRSAAVVTLTASDATSGVAALAYAVDGAAETSVSASTATVTLGDGQHAVTYRAIDAAGNASTAATKAVAVDTRAPAVTLSLSPTSLKANGRLQSVRIGGGATDAGSGVASVSIAVTNKSGTRVATATSFGSTVWLMGTKGQIYTVTATVLDRAGNTGRASASLPVR